MYDDPPNNQATPHPPTHRITHITHNIHQKDQIWSSKWSSWVTRWVEYCFTPSSPHGGRWMIAMFVFIYSTFYLFICWFLLHACVCIHVKYILEWYLIQYGFFKLTLGGGRNLYILLSVKTILLKFVWTTDNARIRLIVDLNSLPILGWCKTIQFAYLYIILLCIRQKYMYQFVNISIHPIISVYMYISTIYLSACKYMHLSLHVPAYNKNN